MYKKVGVQNYHTVDNVILLIILSTTYTLPVNI